MKIPLTIKDYLRRAEQVYADRVAFIDEETQPALSWGSKSYGDMAGLARAQAAGLDALVVRKPGSALTGDELIAHTRTRLAAYKCPKRIEFRTELTRTATGKLKKFKLRAPYWEGRTRQV